MKKAEDILNDFKDARTKNKGWIEDAEKCFEFLLGQQWEDADVTTLKNAGVKALTINKILPFFNLLSGIQRQNRTDFIGYPVGEEDTITSDIVTRLLKNIMINCEGEFKLSEQWEDGVICGKGWIEPYIDYTYNLLTGEMKLKKLDGISQIFYDPDSKEYDLSDAKYVIKLTTELTKDQIYQLFPKEKSKIDKITDTTIEIPGITTKETGGDYQKGKEITQLMNVQETRYDLLEYYYKNYTDKWYVADKITKNIKECATEEEAERYINFTIERDKKRAELENRQFTAEDVTATILHQFVPEIWCASIIGSSTTIADGVAWSYPNWRGYPFVPFFAHRITTTIKKRNLMNQGMVRPLLDPQEEHNKRRTQELRHLNQTANSGWISEEGAWVDKEQVKKLAASPGVMLEYKKGYMKPDKIEPSQLSMGHKVLAEEAAQDMKYISGINPDMLAIEDKTTSGRAILLRQKQGLTMIQKVLDNFERTKKILGKFLLSQLGEVYTVETAIRVIGEGYLTKTFQQPELDEAGKPVLDENTGELKMKVDKAQVGEVINRILHDSSIGKFDVAVGEGSYSETVKFANYSMLMDLISKGVPVPPDVIIDDSDLSEAQKIKIKEAIASMQRQAAAGAGAGGPA